MAKAIASSRPFILSSATCKLPNTRRRFVSVTRAIDGAFSVKLGQLGGRSFAAGAANVSGAGSFDSPLIQSMENKIKEQLNADLVVVKDAYGDGRHVSIDVVASAFEGQSSVNRQRMVYKAIWDVLQNTVHAVDEMTTKTPNEAA